MPVHNAANPTRRALLKGLAAALLPGRISMAADRPVIARPIPGTAETLPVIGLGTYVSFDISAADDLAAGRDVLTQFAAQGGTVVDSSPMYGQAEAAIGQLTAQAGLGGKLFLATKVWTQGRDAGIRQMNASFRLMGTERMDLMQIHNLTDAATHVKTLRDWKAAGRIRYWGISHYHAGAYGEVERFMKTDKPDFLQINYSLGEPESGERLLPLARDLGIAVIANRPFSQGALFIRVKGQPLPEWAADFDAATWAQFFLKWIVADPAVTCAIPATRNPQYLLDNMGAGRGRLPDAATRNRMLSVLTNSG